MIFILLFLSSCQVSEPVYRLVHANDADSFYVTDYNCQIDCQRQELRLIGIDAPEYSQDPWGKAAMNYVVDRIKPDTMIYLENGLTPIDKYGRRLVFFSYLNADKQRAMLQLDLLEHGFAQLFTFDKRQKYLDRFKSAELTARSKHLNIWDTNNGLEMSPSKYRRKQKHK
ncbi:MAG: thermonuclease family protein [Cyanobacteria bacterium]|nr:thermonuclease family protein [Cyanobacteriota bacterium]MDA1020848.1 thermonuclease family protein [Cyanobacteriota bacterium]